MDLPQHFPLVAAVVNTMDIPPSIHGRMGQRDPHVQHPHPLDAPPCSAGTLTGPPVFVQWRQGGSQRLLTMTTFNFNGRGTTAVSGVTATVGVDDIISMGGSNAEMAVC